MQPVKTYEIDITNLSMGAWEDLSNATSPTEIISVVALILNVERAEVRSIPLVNLRDIMKQITDAANKTIVPNE